MHISLTVSWICEKLHRAALVMFKITSEAFVALMEFPTKPPRKGLFHLPINIVSEVALRRASSHVMRLQPQFPMDFFPGKQGFLTQVVKILVIIMPISVRSCQIMHRLHCISLNLGRFLESVLCKSPRKFEK